MTPHHEYGYLCFKYPLSFVFQVSISNLYFTFVIGSFAQIRWTF